MTNQEIMDSTAFKVINHMIDQKAAFVNCVVSNLKDGFDRACNPTYPSTIVVRTYDEDPEQNTEIVLPADLRELKRLASLIDDVVKEIDTIGEMQRQKLRLLNDYDFTHGDNSEQRKIFG